jgi:hypothetical protein
MIIQPAHHAAGTAAIRAAHGPWRRALARARAIATDQPWYIPRLDAYRVHSDRSGNDYMVHPVETDGVLTYHCDCAAGMHGLVCWHAAMVAALPHERERRRMHRATSRLARA